MSGPDLRQSLIGATIEEIAGLPALADEAAYRAQQVASWIYRKGAVRFDEMTNLSGRLRDRLAQSHTLDRTPAASTLISRDGTARKFLFSTSDGLKIEAVLIRAPRRDTVCVSTQAGCAYGCRFCATAQMGFKRNLTRQEMLSQVLTIRDELAAITRPDRRAPQGAGEQPVLGSGKLFNLVFMGMGEPLANYRPLVETIRILQDDFGVGIGRRRITVSTVGLPVEIRRLAQEENPVRLALSLNATTNKTRSQLMPVNRRHPIEEVLPALADYGRVTGNRTTLEYVLIDGVNDSLEDAQRLARFARQHNCKVNLIQFNPHPLTELRPSPPERMQRFHDLMLPLSPTVTIRESRGGDILAACGQLSTAYGEELGGGIGGVDEVGGAGGAGGVGETGGG